MDFEFENKDDFFEDDQPDTENVADEFTDISSNSSFDSFGMENEAEDIMSYSAKAKAKPKRNVKRIVINSVTSVILAICVLLTTVMGWYVSNADTSLQNVPILRWLFGGAKYGDIGYDTNQVESGDFEELMKSISDDVTYFLVVGCDWTDSKQTDVIVVVCMDHKNNTVSMLQIPRDTYVNGSPDNKINSVFNNAREGELNINALRRCLSSQLGIPIDHYILFSIEGAVNVVDAIGGVTMNFDNEITIEDPLKFGKYYKIGPGEVRMSGKDAIGFMRKRRIDSQEETNDYDGSDIGRVKQQRKFYAALFKELMGMSTTEIWKVANSCFNQIQTDLTLNETVAYALAAKGLDMNNIHIFGLPGQACSYGLSYYSVHKDDYVECFNTYFNPYGDPITEESITIPEIYSIAGYAKNEYWMSTDDSTLNEY